MADLTEESVSFPLAEIRKPGMAIEEMHLVISEEVLSQMKALCADDPEFRKQVLAQFPQLEDVL